MNGLGFEIFADGDLIVVRNRHNLCGSDDLREILHFLQYEGKKVIRWVWHVDEFAAAILRKLPEDKLAEITGKDKSTIVERYRLYYIPGVLFQVGPPDVWWGTVFYGLKGFLNIPGFPPTPTLDEIDRTGQEILDAAENMGLGGEHVKAATPMSLFLSSDRGSAFMNSLPLGRHLPSQIAGDLTYLSTLADDKHLVETRAIGHWDEGEIWDYDLTGAYVSIATKLLDLRDLTFYRSGDIETGAYYGMVQGKMWIDPDGECVHASPIVCQLPNGLQGAAVGELPEDVYTLDEIRTVRRYGIGEFTPTGMGIFAKTLSCTRPRLPYKDMLEWLFEQRRWGDMESKISKVCGNAIVGKMIEKHDGALYRNRFYHAIITAATRCAITRFLCDNGVKAREFLAVQTDGVRLSKNIPLSNGNRLGTWRNNGSSETVLHSPRRVYVDDKRPFQVTLSDVKQMVSEHPNVERYSKKAKRFTTIQEALEAGDLSKVGEYNDFPAYVDLIKLDMQQTRIFRELPSSGSELLNGKYYSEPIVMGG